MKLEVPKRMNRSRRLNLNRYLANWKALIILFVLSLFLCSTPVIAQSSDNASLDTKPFPVKIDGRPIFELKKFKDETAQERAERVNETLKEVVESQQKADVEIEKDGNSSIIRVNDKYLLTVTQKDADPSKTEEQASKWKAKLSKAIERARSERTSEVIRKNIIDSLGIVVSAVIFHWFLGRLWGMLRTRLNPILDSGSDSSDQQQHHMLDVLLKATLFLLRTALWLWTTLNIADRFPLTSQWSSDIKTTIITALGSPIVNNYSIINLLILVGLFFAIFISAGTVTNILRSRVLQFLSISRGAQEAIAVVFKYALIAVGTVILLQVWGIDLSSLAILASALGVGIGFGFQDIAKNFGSGIVLIFERPIQVGDFIEVGDSMGTVENIGARSVTIRTLDRISIIVPNSKFLESEVINWSHHNPISRIHLPVGVSYSSDPHKVKNALLEAAQKHPEVAKVPQPQVFFTGFGDNSLDFELLVWIDKPARQAPIKSELNFRIEASLRNHNIEVPFPQRDIHVRSGELPLKLSDEVEEALMHMRKITSHNNSTTHLDKDTV